MKMEKEDQNYLSSAEFGGGNRFDVTNYNYNGAKPIWCDKL